MSLTPHQSNTVIVCYLVQYSPIGIFLSVKSRGPTKNMRQAREYYSQQERQKKKWCFVTLTEIRSGLALQGIYCNIISIQVALHIKLLDPQLQQQFINYAQTLNMQAYLMGTLCQFSWLVCLCIHIRV